ncbi:MAG: helix-turn-helix transcriptional regulator [Candidatus Omnitrophota bacterium]|nr:helix-turn-helix transcriptional regulator [Candidatus Omnitrophota bacterium]
MRSKAGEIMRQTRTGQGVTIEELSRKTGVPQEIISRFELGLERVPEETLSALLKALKG